MEPHERYHHGEAEEDEGCAGEVGEGEDGRHEGAGWGRG